MPAVKAAPKSSPRTKSAKGRPRIDQKPILVKSKTAARPAQTVAERAVESSRDLFQAGLSALSLPRAESAMADGLSKIADSFGIRKLEDVFDHRVASALERLGYPSAAEFAQLMDRLDALAPPARKKGRSRS